MKFGVIQFPGSNCDDDMIHVLKDVMGQDAVKLWHKNTDLSGLTTEDCIVVPGGFSYGDYVRAGAVARFSPIMEAVPANTPPPEGTYSVFVMGFQILCEAHLLPGGALAQTRNRNSSPKMCFSA